jgi:hypothetical protein
LTVNALVLNGTTLFAGTNGGVFVYNGSTWSAVNSGLTNTYISALAANGGLIFAGTSGGGVFRTTNNGTSWTAVSSPSGMNYVNAFAFSGTNLFVAAPGDGGIFFTTNSGASWTAANTGLMTSSVATLSVWTSTLYAGLSGGAVWRRPIAEMITSVETSSGGIPTVFELSQNYPNPFNPSTTIKFELPKSSDVRLSVFDMLGREVSALVKERRDAGVHEVKFDGSNLASGVYFYRIQAGDFVQTRKLLLVR